MIKERENFDMYKKPSISRPKPVRATRKGLYLDDITKQIYTKAGNNTYKIERTTVIQD